MRLDRYSGQKPKYRVINMRTGADVDPSECFVLKRRDVNAVDALEAYSTSALVNGDAELAADVDRLNDEWEKKTRELGDAKMPD